MTALAPTATTVDSLCDSDLVAAVRGGDDSAFEEVYRRYSERIRAYVFGMVRDHGRAEDVTQEVFLSALRRLRVTDASIALRPWLYEIAKNASIDVFRRTSRAEEVSISADEALRPADHLRLVGDGDRPESAAISKERLDHLQGAFDELSESHHRILVLRELEGLSYREIGERMELTRPAVESTLFRARRRLQREYEDIDTGARCAAIASAIGRLAEGIESGRERSRVARHVRRCPGCRHRARELGVSVDRRPLRAKVAALFPLPVLFRRRRGEGGPESASAPVHSGATSLQQVAGTWVPTVAGPGAETTAGALGKAAALVLTAALAGSGAVAVQHRFSPVSVTRDRDAATEKRSSEPREALRPDTAPLSPETIKGPAPEPSAPAGKKRSGEAAGDGSGLSPGMPPLEGPPAPPSGGFQPLVQPPALPGQPEQPAQPETPAPPEPIVPPVDTSTSAPQGDQSPPPTPPETGNPVGDLSSALNPNPKG
jgi:RNA polymerase sigma factor (sigma-70 family)